MPRSTFALSPDLTHRYLGGQTAKVILITHLGDWNTLFGEISLLSRTIISQTNNFKNKFEDTWDNFRYMYINLFSIYAKYYNNIFPQWLNNRRREKLNNKFVAHEFLEIRDYKSVMRFWFPTERSIIQARTRLTFLQGYTNCKNEWLRRGYIYIRAALLFNLRQRILTY